MITVITSPYRLSPIKLVTPLLLAILTFFYSGGQTNAHELTENTARVTLRDGQVEIYLQLDRTHWIAQLQNNQAWLMGDISQLMPTKLTAPQQSQFMEKLLTTHTVLYINEEKLIFDHATFLPQNKNAKHHFTLVKLTGHHKQKNVSQLSLHFPPSLGAVYTSVVKPQYQMIPAGNTRLLSFPAEGTALASQETHQHRVNQTN